MRTRFVFAAVVTAVLLAFPSCGTDMIRDDLQDETEVALRTVAGMRVFFGHQSVGRNILDGIDDLSALSDVSISRGAVEDGVDPASVAFLDAHLEENLKPMRKVEHFAELIRSGIGGSVNVALMKFCYVDTYENEDADSILSHYLTTMESLEAEYPDTTFVYVTMPLSSPMTGFRNVAKRILGRLRMVDDGREANALRNRFNEMLRDAKGDTGRLFDLAFVESTKPDGERYAARVSGTTLPALFPEYTWDGGHLNELGRRVVAEELVRFLAELGE